MTSFDLSSAPRTIAIAIPSERRGFAANGIALWGFALACTLADVALLPFAGFSVTGEGLICLNPIMAIILAPLAAFYTFVRYDEAIASVTNAFAVLIAVTPLLCLFTYIAAAIGHSVPLQDPTLAGFDASVGFDWRAMLRWADGHPALVGVGSLAYRSIAVQGALMVLALTASAQVERLQVVIYAYMISAMACGAISGLVPALGTYTFYGIEPSQFAHIGLVTRDMPVPDVLALRSGSFATYSVGSAKGIISFPSFHATLGVLFGWSMWRARWLRWPAVALNAVLVAATPLEGSHHLADVLAGVAVAGAAIAAGLVLHRWIASRAARASISRSVGSLRFH